MPVQPSPPPHIPADALRPGRRWYAAAGVTAVVLVVTGLLIGAFRLDGATGSVDTGRPFADGDVVTLRLEPGSDKAVWIKDREFGPAADPECSITGPGDPGLGEPGVDVFLTRGETWNPLHTIDVRRAGDHRITCTSDAQSAYAIGDSGGYVALAGRLVLAVAPVVLGLTACAAAVLVTAFRRSRHRKRLLAGPPR
ncbi:hypothetical protein SUDANB120_03842 [Streptomyces sp. enrichment culture]|uniref:hypothetical protein n=1 Tax=Streptomyces sp. enrichment culture TaxID=1795815 RepID=UPI003F551256